VHHGDTPIQAGRIARFLESGAPAPDGVTIKGRWFTASHNKGYMLVEASDVKPLFRFVSEWADIMDFQIEPVIGEEDAAPILQELQ